MSATATMSVPGIELAQMGRREHPAPSPTSSLQSTPPPHRDHSHRPSQDQTHATEAPNSLPSIIPLVAQETRSPILIPTVRLTTSTEQTHSSSITSEGHRTPDGNVENASLRQAGSGPPSPVPLSTQSTLVPPSISSVRTSQTNLPPSSFEALFPQLSRIVKTDSIHYQRTRHVLGKIFSLMTIVVTLLGVFIYSMRAYVLAKWTSAKDFWEYCNSPSTHDNHCQSIKDKYLVAPPYNSEKFFLDDRSPPYPATPEPKTASHLWVLAITIVPIVLIAAALLLVYFASRRSKPRQLLPPSAPNDCNVRTQIPISWATDPNRNIYLDKSYSTSTATNFAYRSSSTPNGSIRHPSLEGPQQPVKRLKISSNLKDPSKTGAHASSHNCDHDWRSEWHPQGWRDICKKCMLEVVDGPTHGEFKEKHEEWERKREELKEVMKADLEGRRNRASIALHKTGDTLMKIINREPLDGAAEVGAMSVEEDGHAEIELSPARLGALGLVR